MPNAKFAKWFLMHIFALILSTSCFAQTPASSGSPSQTPTSAGGDASDDLIKAILLKEAAKIIAANIDASKREVGELDKLIRAIAGISVADIRSFGICGGPNSEVRKLAGDLCK